MQGSEHFRIGVREGDILAGKYRVERILGTGGMGVVVAARHLKLDERVAIKFLLHDALENVEAVARFDREARAAVKIKSEHVARVIDVGTLDNGSPYMIMEYLEGEDLARWLQTRGPFSVEQAVEFVLQTCEAIAEAHGLGIIHRDLKPSNLFCIRRADGLLSVKVLDFGISKVAPGALGPAMDMTQTGAVLGSPLYMSPEQMRSTRTVDARTDIWAIGVILYELLSGTVPFKGTTLPEVCMSIATRPTPSLRAKRPEVPGALELIVARCLEKERSHRYSNVAELAVALAPFGPRRARASVDRISRVISSAGLSASSMALPPSSAPAESDASTLSSWGRTARTFGQRAGLLGVAAVFLFGLIAVRMKWLQSEDAPRSSGAMLDAMPDNPPKSVLSTTASAALDSSETPPSSRPPAAPARAATSSASSPPAVAPSTAPPAAAASTALPVVVAVPRGQQRPPAAVAQPAAVGPITLRPAPAANAPPASSSRVGNRSELGGRL